MWYNIDIIKNKNEWRLIEMTLAKALMKTVRIGDVDVVIGKYWADIALRNGLYFNSGFVDEQAVKDFLDLWKPPYLIILS